MQMQFSRITQKLASLVPMHVRINRFTSEKFPPPPQCLHPIKWESQFSVENINSEFY